MLGQLARPPYFFIHFKANSPQLDHTYKGFVACTCDRSQEYGEYLKVTLYVKKDKPVPTPNTMTHNTRTHNTSTQKLLSP